MAEFEELYKLYFHDVFLYLKSLTNNESLAEELTSETFFKAMGAVENFRGDCDIRVWLCQIAKNCYYSYRKKHPASLNLEEAEQLGLAQGCDELGEALTAKSEAMEIHLLLHDLKEPYKEVFMLRVFGELRFQQIGRIFGKTENWACVTYHRARRKLIEKMEGTHDEK